MSGPLQTLRLVYPRETASDSTVAAMRLLATFGGTPLVLQAFGQYACVEHRIKLPEGHRAAVTTQLRAAIPGLGVEIVDGSWPRFDMALEIRLSTARRSVRTDQIALTSAAVIHALAGVGADEALLLEWVLVDRLHAEAVSNREAMRSESLVQALLRAPLGVPAAADADTRSALRQKRSEPGWRAVGRLAVKAATRSRRQQSLRNVLSAMRLAEGPDIQLRARLTRAALADTTRGAARSRLNAVELAALCAWPVGATGHLPIARTASRRLPAPTEASRSGRLIGLSSWPGSARELRLGGSDSLRHLHVLGPTGTGKSSLLLNLILQDVEANRAVVVIEPKGDLIDDIMARVPVHRQSDVILVDPTDQVAPVGLNPLRPSEGQSADLVADQLLGVFHKLYAAHWGPRTSDIMHAALLTLARTPGMSLAALPMLLADQSFRRRVVGALHDPLGLGPFWAQYEAWSDAERAVATAPVLNKLRPFLMRPMLRRVVGQAEPRWTMASAIAERKVVLVSLAKGQLGPEASNLVGGLFLSMLWQTALSRTTVAKERRAYVGVYIDEFQDYLHLPTDLGDALAQARGLGFGFTLAHQHLAQLDSHVRAGVLANARSRVCFQLEQSDAKVFAAQNLLLDAEDFTSLEAYHFYAQLVSNSTVQPWCSGRSLPPAGPVGDPRIIREMSRTQFGVPAADIDRDLENIGRPTAALQKPSVVTDLTPRRRTSKRGGQP